MKSSKTTLKGDAKKSKLKTADRGVATSGKTIVIVIISAVIILAMVGGMVYENFRPRTEFTINGDKITLSDIMYYIYETEAQYSYMDQLYEQFYGTSYWDEASSDDSTKTNREAAKDELLDTYKQTYVLYQEALKNGYEINSDDKETAESDVSTLRKQLSFAQKGLTGMTKSKLTKVLEMKACADRYKQDIIDGFDIDDDAIKAGVSKEDYRQYDVQYYSINITTTDEDGNSTIVSDADLKVAEDELTELAERAKTEDFDTLTPEAKESSSEDTEATASADPEPTVSADTEDTTDYQSTFVSDGKFVAGDGTFTTEVEDEVKEMDNDEISGVIKGESAYYLVKMVNNNDSEAYDEEVDNEIQDEEDSEFDDWYADIEGDYTVTTNDKEWDKLTMGDVIISK